MNDRLRRTRARYDNGIVTRAISVTTKVPEVARRECFHEACLPLPLFPLFILFPTRNSRLRARRRAIPNRPLAGKFGEQTSARLNSVFIGSFFRGRLLVPSSTRDSRDKKRDGERDEPNGINGWSNARETRAREMKRENPRTCRSLN